MFSFRDHLAAGFARVRRWEPAAVPLAALLLIGCSASSEQAVAKAAEAQQLLEASRIAEAENVINDAIRDRDDIAEVYLVQAHIALARGNRPAAYQAYSNVLALSSTNPEALMGVAQLGLTTGHTVETEAAADKILVLDPQQTEAMIVKALLAIARSDLDGALAQANHILEVKPDDRGGLIVKARVLALRGDRAGALALLNSGNAQTAYAPEFAMARAELYRADGDIDAFIVEAQRVKAAQPDNIDYRFDLADAFYRKGQTDRARAEIAALIAKPITAAEQIESVVRLWYGYDQVGLTPAMAQAAAKGASLEARLAFSRFLIANGRAPVAAAILKPLATGWSGEIQAMDAYAADSQGDADAARRMETLLEEDTDNGAALLVRARHAMRSGHANEAVVASQQVISNYPGWDEGYLALAAAYAALDKPAGVRRAFDDGLRARPQSLPLATAYVERLSALGDRQRALAVARRFALDSPSLIRGWAFYAATCARFGGDECRAEIATGSARARRLIGLDPTPGTRPPIAAIGRLT